MIFLLIIKTIIYWIDLSQKHVNISICVLDHETIITLQKANKKIIKSDFQ